MTKLLSILCGRLLCSGGVFEAVVVMPSRSEEKLNPGSERAHAALVLCLGDFKCLWCPWRRCCFFCLRQRTGLSLLRPVKWTFLCAEQVACVVALLFCTASLLSPLFVRCRCRVQTEADPQVISLLMEREGYGDVAAKLINVAGHRVTTDPLAIPFSMGRNLFWLVRDKQSWFWLVGW